MSFGICRVAKFTKGDVGGIMGHDERIHNVSYSNPDIDFDRSKENINLVDREVPYQTYIKERIDTLDLKKAVRKDANVMCQVLITSDESFFKSQNDNGLQFFKDSLKFVENRYGKENIVSANIHFDEKTPHMHINFVPIIDNRLSAKDIFKLGSYQKLQNDIHNDVFKNYSLERGKASDLKHKPLAEYKEVTNYNKELIEQTKEIKHKNEFLEKKLSNESATFKEMQENYYVNSTQKMQIDEIKPKKHILGDKVTISGSEYTELVNQAKNTLNVANERDLFKSKHQAVEKELKLQIEQYGTYQKLQSRINEISERELRSKELFNKQANLNTSYKLLLKENNELREERDLLKNVSNELSDKVQDLERVIENLKAKFDDLCECFCNITKGFNNLKWDKSENGYGVVLNKKQDKLFIALENYCTGWLKKFGRNDLVENIEKSISFSGGIVKELNLLDKPKKTIGLDR